MQSDSQLSFLPYGHFPNGNLRGYIVVHGLLPSNYY